MCEVDSNIIEQLFGSQDVGFAFSPSIEMVVAIICCWSLVCFREVGCVSRASLLFKRTRLLGKGQTELSAFMPRRILVKGLIFSFLWLTIFHFMDARIKLSLGILILSLMAMNSGAVMECAMHPRNW